ncbi:stromal cell-derived factor 2-like [Ptychodera flava]|uniref:stromal cell-derived factor 2-like n=1 Tax=Ptychodera flava TaxID=63121 RepID=UPI003969BB86
MATSTQKLCSQICWTFLIICSLSGISNSSTDEYGMEYDFVTCGSVIKLKNTRYNIRLHSHDVKYGSGSGQQSVTGMDNAGDGNSYWQIKGKEDKPCTRGTPIKCGQTIRLMHSNTRRNLHSHFFAAPLTTRHQEVSAFGDSGQGDEGDHWAVTCSSTHWRRDEPVRFKHVPTEVYLGATDQVYGRPIRGQREIAGIDSPSSNTHWKVMEGVYIKPNES